MPLGYNPSDYDPEQGGGGKVPPGDYLFKVDEVEEVRFKTGNMGLKIKLLVGALPDKDIQCFTNIVYTEKALWKLNEFLTCIGLDFSRPPEIHQLLNKTGHATFGLNEKEYLTPEEFHPPSANNGPDTRPYTEAGPPPHTDDDALPF